MSRSAASSSRGNTKRHAVTNSRRSVALNNRAASSRSHAMKLHAISAVEADSIAGVGRWTSAEVRRVALGDPDAVSVGDYHLPHAVAWALAGEARADDARMLELLEPFAGHRARVVRLIEVAAIGAPRRGPRMPLRAIARH